MRVRRGLADSSALLSHSLPEQGFDNCSRALDLYVCMN